MTSRSLFFKLMREDMKRRIWAIGLAFLLFFFWMPVASAMGASNILRSYENMVWDAVARGMTMEEAIHRDLLDLALETIGLVNPLTAFTIACAAIVLGITGFMYLHSRKQVDFFHSAPVRREAVFAIRYLNGLLVVVSMYLVNMILALGVLAMNGVAPGEVAGMAFVTMIVHMAGFLLIYGVMILAVLLTGNFFISILGGIVLYSYLPAMAALVQGLMYMFYATVDASRLNFSNFMAHSSPISYYVMLVGEGASKKLAAYGEMLPRTGLAFLVALVLAAVCMALHKLRPSESSGKAMAFKVTKAPIKILLVVPTTIMMGVFFWNVYYRLSWAVFGFLMGLVISHCIIEIIYHFEFRKLFANAAHMGICAVLALAVIGFYRFDLYGYDRYIPDESAFESVSIIANGLNDSQGNYGLPVREEGDPYSYDWQYISNRSYVENNMAVTDYGTVKALADAGVTWAKVEKEESLAGEWGSREEGYWTDLYMAYHLKNGKTVYRYYRASVTELREVFDRLYVTAEYKNGVYPVLNYTPESVTGIYAAKAGEISEVTTDAALVREILAAYQEEMTALTLAERAKETPVTSLRFLTAAEKDYVSYMTRSRRPGFAGDFSIDDMAQVNFFPVYPSFEKTLKLLKKAGLDAEQGLTIDEIEQVEIVSAYGYPNREYADEDIYEYGDQIAYSYEKAYAVSSADTIRLVIKNDKTAENERKLKEVLATIEPIDMMDMNRLQPIDHSISVTILTRTENEDESQYVSYLFRVGEMPEFVKEAVHYDELERYDLSYGLDGEIH